MQIDIQKIINISKEAGAAILEVYNSDDFNIESKDDNSPLTLADRKSHEIISNFLKSEYPEIPVLSEEGREIDFNERKNWEYFWLVDPLDGTKEFIKRNGEFTVNIALIKNHTPILGVIFVPVTGELYFGKVEEGAFKQNKDNVVTEIVVSSKTPNDDLIVVQSRSHSGDEENEFYSNYKIIDRISKGSSLKICMVAEGKAEIYFRSGPTWEWDTAAGHAILSAAGGYFVNKNFTPLIYNKKVIKNFGFIASSFKIDN